MGEGEGEGSWHGPRLGEFDSFSPLVLFRYYSGRRVWGAFRLVKPSLALDPTCVVKHNIHF